MNTVTEARNLYRPRFKQWLIDLRHGQALTLQEIADRVGCSKQHASQIEAGKKLPMEASAVKFSEMYNVSPLEFLMKGGVMPAWLILHLAWNHFEEFQDFILSLEQASNE